MGQVITVTSVHNRTAPSGKTDEQKDGRTGGRTGGRDGRHHHSGGLGGGMGYRNPAAAWSRDLRGANEGGRNVVVVIRNTWC